jgi:hypothetical protein
MYYCDIAFNRGWENGDLIIDEVIGWLYVDEDEHETVRQNIQAKGAIPVYQDGGRIFRDPDYLQIPEPMAWVTPMTTYNRKNIEIHGEDKPFTIDGDACMVVRVGKVGDRLAYPTLRR